MWTIAAVVVAVLVFWGLRRAFPGAETAAQRRQRLYRDAVPLPDDPHGTESAPR